MNRTQDLQLIIQEVGTNSPQNSTASSTKRTMAQFVPHKATSGTTH
jgi:hypothetical protein